MLINNIRPSQRPVWSCRFRDPVEVAKLGGTLTGSPTFTGDGVKLDGSQYGTFPLTTEFNRDAFTIKCVFTPEFDWDEGVTRSLFGTSADAVSVTKFSASPYILQFVVAGTAIKNVSYTQYSAFWKLNEKNTVLLSVAPSENNYWVNGNSMGSNALAWSFGSFPNEITIGALETTANRFLGTIHEFSLYDGLWTEDEVADDYNHATYHF